MSDQTTRFSIIVPIYGVEQYLYKCIDSILEQTYENFELILVDDGSKDKCPSICDQYAKKDSRIRVLHQENQGLVAARNNGLHIATGDYVCHIDGDDWISPKYLEVIHKRIAESPKNPDIVLFGAKEVFLNESSYIINHIREGWYSRDQIISDVVPKLMVEVRDTLKVGWHVLGACWNKCYERKYLLEHYNRDTKIKMGEDLAFSFECIMFADSMMVCNDILYFYNRTNETSMTAQDKRRGLDDNRIRLINYMFNRMYGKDPTIDRQLNAYAAFYMIRGAMDFAKHSDNPAKDYKAAIKKSKILDKVNERELPRNTKIFVKMTRMGLYGPAMMVVKRKVK